MLHAIPLTIGNLACAAGFTLVPGDVAGWGTVCNQGGGDKVSKCDDCAAKCSACDGCRSYECSATELKCSLNIESKPSTAQNNKDYAFCVKGLKEGNTHILRSCQARLQPLFNLRFVTLSRFMLPLLRVTHSVVLVVRTR